MSDHSEKTITTVIDPEKQLEKYKTDLSKDAEVVDDQRFAANEDMRFINVDGGMWEGDFENLGNRVKLELDMCSDYVQRFIGEWNQNRVGVEFKPDDDKTNDDDADLINGIYRADFRQSKGKLATDNAVDEVATCGYGAMKLGTFFVDEGDPENFDKRVEWRPIYNAYNTVIWDQGAKRIDKSDARWSTELTGFTVDAFEEQYPDKTPSSAYTPENFSNSRLNRPTFVFVASRYEVVRQRKTVFVYDNLTTKKRKVYEEADHEEIKAQLKDDDKYNFVGERRPVLQHVDKTVFSGDDILKKTRRITGKWIPIIPFYGYRGYVDGVEQYRGLVRKLKDACRLFNMQVSQFAESASSGSSRKPLFDPEQMEGTDIANHWKDMNNKPWLPVRVLRDEAGNIIANGPIGYLEPDQLSGQTVALAQVVPDYLQRVTGGIPQDTLDPDASGKAIRALMKRENMTTQVVNDNIANAIAWSGTIYQSMAAEVYNTQRKVKILGQDGTEGEKLLNETIMNPETGMMVEINTLQGKRFHSYSDTGPQYETLREDSFEQLKEMLPALSGTQVGEQYTPVVLSAIIENMTGVGLSPLKDFNRRIMIQNGTIEPETDEEKAALAQFQQQAQEPDATQKFLEASAVKEQSEARSFDASSIQKTADARKKEAETAEILADIDLNQLKLFLEAQKQLSEQTIETAEALPIQ